MIIENIPFINSYKYKLLLMVIDYSRHVHRGIPSMNNYN